RHTRRSTLSTSLESQNPKAKSSMVAYAISQNLDLMYHRLGNASKRTEWDELFNFKKLLLSSDKVKKLRTI
ncbi:MAG: hypothetical protein WBC02_01070, partial [Candidatus Aminicenantaceae bacterium]